MSRTMKPDGATPITILLGDQHYYLRSKVIHTKMFMSIFTVSRSNSKRYFNNQLNESVMGGTDSSRAFAVMPVPRIRIQLQDIMTSTRG